MKIAHISDIHFANPTWNPFQIFSKQIIGNINYLLNRKKVFSPRNCYHLLDQLKSLQIDAVIISGDLSTTSSKGEFALAREFIQKLKDLPMEVYVIPGNHDNYTKSAYKNKNFYRYLGSVIDFSSDASIPFTLEEDGLLAKKITSSHWIVLMDTTSYTSLIYSNGTFQQELQDKLSTLLSSIPKEEKIILVNHFPFFQQEGPLKDLKNGRQLQHLLKQYPNLLFYLHGHTHRSSIVDLRNEKLPIILDAGCITAKKRSTWNLIHLDKAKTSIDVYCSKEDTPHWEIIKHMDVEV